MKRIYLAGPDVFFHAAALHFDELEARCAAHGLQGLRPSDGGLSHGVAGSGDEIAERIYRSNLDLIRDCDALLANLMPFRNSLEPDSGTVFELGMAVALGKPVAGFLADSTQRYEVKVAHHCGLQRAPDGTAWDQIFGFMIEEFEQPMNLMLARSTPLFETFDQALADLCRRLA
ncbi:nucleoside 2-deoxyribosyltransferase [soil metagenome]